MKKLGTIVVGVALLLGAAYYLSTQQAPVTNVDPRLAAAAEILTGTWSNVDDRNMEREYMADGKAIDSVGSTDGEIETPSTWSIFTAETAGEVPFQLNSNDVYIMHTDTDGGVTYLRVIDMNQTEMEVMDVETGVSAHYGKMTTGYEMQDGFED